MKLTKERRQVVRGAVFDHDLIGAIGGVGAWEIRALCDDLDEAEVGMFSWQTAAMEACQREDKLMAVLKEMGERQGELVGALLWLDPTFDFQTMTPTARRAAEEK